jgi:hypothetical protein
MELEGKEIQEKKKKRNKRKREKKYFIRSILSGAN